MELIESYTSTGKKMFAHQEVMTKLRGGRGQPVTTHVMLTDVCNHSCAFCSVQHRAGDSLLFKEVMAYVDILKHYGLKSVILSGGGNPILYKCRETGRTFANVVEALHDRGLEIGLITNGAPLRPYTTNTCVSRKSWVMVAPRILDMLTWVRVSMAGLDHQEREVYVPDVDPDKTTLGFSYVAHDIYTEPADHKHGKVSRPLDLLSGDRCRVADESFEDRLEELRNKFIHYCEMCKPKYLRLLPNCLEPNLIEQRCGQLQSLADVVNHRLRSNTVFVQYKPPKAPKACYLGFIHPVLNCDGYIYPCDSCVLNEAAGHQFGKSWRVCHWINVASIYTKKVKSLIENPAKMCPGCVFTRSNEILGSVVDGTADLTPPAQTPEHVNFV